MLDFQLRHRIVVAVVSGIVLVSIGAGLRRNASVPVTVDSRQVNNVTAAPSSVTQATGRFGGASTGKSSSEKLVVHICGAVRRPDVYSIRPDLRVVDLVRMAGGPTGNADLDAVNLASRLTDGQQIVIPRKTADSRPSRAAVSKSSRSGPASRIDVNTASEQELDTLPGIGPSIARRIIDYREANGPFTRSDDLLSVSGIGEKKLERMKPFLHLP